MDNPFGPAPANNEQQQQPVTQEQQATTNPFGPAPTAQQQSNDDQGWFMAGVDGLNRQFEKMAIGTMQLASYLAPGTQTFRDNLSQLDQHGYGGVSIGAEQADKSFQEHPYAYGTGAVGGVVGSSIAYGGLASMPARAIATKVAPQVMSAMAESPILNRTVSGAAGAAGYGATTPADSLGEHLTNAAVSAPLGALGANIIPAIKSVSNAVIGSPNYVSSLASRIFTPDKAAVKDIAARAGTKLAKDAGANEVTPDLVNNVDNSLNSYDILGMNLTPGQALGSPAILEVEKNAAKGITGGQQYGLYNESQLNKLRNQTTTLLDNMAPPEVHDLKTELYAKLPGNNLSEDAMSSIETNPTINKYLKEINTPNSGIQIPDKTGNKVNISDMPNTDISKLDYIKQMVDYDAKSVFNGKTISKQNKDELMAARNLIINSIDKEHGDIYIPARQAAQKVIIQNKYKEILSKVTNATDENISTEIDGASFKDMNAFKNMTGVNKALFGNDEKIAQFLDDVSEVGGNTETAKAIIEVTHKLSPVKTEQILKNNDSAISKGLSAGGNKTNFVQNMLFALGDKGYQQAILDLTTSGKWTPLIKKEIINQANMKDKQTGFLKLILQASSPYVRNSINSGISRGIYGIITPKNDDSNNIIPK